MKLKANPSLAKANNNDDESVECNAYIMIEVPNDHLGQCGHTFSSMD